METIHEKIASMLEELTATITKACADAEARANDAKNIIAEQILVLTEAADTMYSIAEMEEDLANTLDASSENLFNQADKITDFIDSMPDFDEPVEENPMPDHEFVGNCKKCGKDLYYDEYVVDTPAGRLCDECHQYYMEHGTLDPVEEPWPMG